MSRLAGKFAGHRRGERSPRPGCDALVAELTALDEPGAAGDRSNGPTSRPARLFQRLQLDLLGADHPGIVAEISAVPRRRAGQHRGAQHQRARRPDGRRDAVRGTGRARAHRLGREHRRVAGSMLEALADELMVELRLSD